MIVQEKIYAGKMLHIKTKTNKQQSQKLNKKTSDFSNIISLNLPLRTKQKQLAFNNSM